MQYAEYFQPDSGSSSYDTIGLSILAEPAAGLASEDGTNWELALPPVDGSGGLSPAGMGPPLDPSPGPSPTSWQASFSRMEDLLLDLSLGKPPTRRPSVDAAAAAASARAPLGHFEVPWQPTGVRASVEPEGAAASALDFAHFASSSMSSMSVASICHQSPQPSRIPERMVDKRQARLINAASFCAAIEEHRASQALSNPTGCDAFALSARAAEAAQADAIGGYDAWGSVAAFVRKRPLLEHEVQKGDFDAATVSADGSSLTAHCCLMKPDLVRMFIRHLSFSPSGGAFDETATADEARRARRSVYSAAAQPLVRHAMEGGRGTMFMYGQTGSGKTFTMEQIFDRASAQLFGLAYRRSDSSGVKFRHGASSLDLELRSLGDSLASDKSMVDAAETGVGASADGQRFSESRKSLMRASGRSACEASPPAGGYYVSCIEAMGKKCVDLLSHGECSLHQLANGALKVFGVQRTRVCSAEQLRFVLAKAFAARKTEATAANSHSSRSHAILLIEPVGANGESLGGRLTLVDCAGSEWNGDSHAHCARRRQESAEINTSLHALKQCVRAYAERARTRRRTRMPYRDSTLTRLLVDSFDDASCRLVVLGCVAPASVDTEHTISTLRTVMELSPQTSAGASASAGGTAQASVSAQEAATGAAQCTTTTQHVRRLRLMAHAASH